MKKSIISIIKKNKYLFISILYIKNLFQTKSSKTGDKTKDQIIEHLYQNGFYVHAYSKTIHLIYLNLWSQ